ncbi:hypothetical protein RB614_04740 [Phytohabitans sp. ZYX-F-186]|uniref:Uncharacterized protein n=1 Tax=Phytohabitans maris TaxID=3071409 RepID=A0ABU0Z9U8_9ACTN|nr:hypothetical protein [Phytohabitans sp. ZYX-F-186]MDQ7903825.1 hypothetical protein [Phytohabitans sp. ZYX-F-186]
MTRPARPARKPTTRAKRIARVLKVLVFAGVPLAAVGVWLAVAPPSLDGGTTVPAPDGEMGAQTAAQLAKASAAQGVCYGWQLRSGGTSVSRGSNLGAGTAVDSDPARCPRWVEVQASVTWTSSASEAPDSAWVTVAAQGVAPPPESRLDRFGITDGAFVDEPDWAVCQAALALPLLLAETGAVPPAPVATAGAAAGPAPEAGSDFWRDRWPFAVGAAVLLALAALTVAIGWFERKHERTRARPAPTAPTPAAGP